MESDQPPRFRSRHLLLVATAALALMGAGGWWSLRSMGSAAVPGASPALPAAPDGPGEPSGEAPVPRVPDAAPGRKSPRDFGLPAYPSAFDFRSMETGPGSASSAFLLKKGTAAEVTRFYIRELGGKGWEYRWKRETTTSPGDPKQGLTLHGTRVRWVHPADRKQLTLLVLDDSQPGRTAQAVLSWAPIESVKPVEVKGSRAAGPGEAR